MAKTAKVIIIVSDKIEFKKRDSWQIETFILVEYSNILLSMREQLNKK